MRWYRAWRRGGRGALRAAGRAGRKPRVTPEQLAEIDTALRQGPRAQGFRTNLWTLPRVARLIKRLTGVQYHPGHVWRLLGILNWTVQRPAKRAKERNDVAIRHWICTRWPAVKKRPPPRLDRLSGRERRLAATLGPPHVGAMGRNARADPRLQLEKALRCHGGRVPVGLPALCALLSDPTGSYTDGTFIEFLKT